MIVGKLKKLNLKKILPILFFVILAAFIIIFFPTHHNTGDTKTTDRSASGLSGDRLIIPRINLDEQIFNDTKQGAVSDEFLDKGLSYYDESTNKPGQGNVVIFGHSARTSEHGAPFRKIGINELKKEDKIILTDKTKKEYVYTVTEIKTVQANDFSIIKPTPEQTITLVTCIAPNFPKDKRLVVIGRLKQ